MSNDVNNNFVQLMNTFATQASETSPRKKKPKLWALVLGVVLVTLLMGLPIMLIWNHLLLGFLGFGSTMSYWQGVATYIFAKLLR